MPDTIDNAQPAYITEAQAENTEQQTDPAETEVRPAEIETLAEASPASASIKARRGVKALGILAIVVVVLAAVAGGGFLGLRWYESSNLQKAQAALSAGDWVAAEAASDQALRLESTGLMDNPLALIAVRGEARFKQGKYDLALADLALVQQAQPENVQIYQYQAEIYYAQGKHSEAMSSAAEAQKRDDKLAFPYALQAYDAYQNNQFPAALEKANAAIERYSEKQHGPGMELAYLVRGSIRVWQHDLELALEDINQALALAPDQPWALSMRAYINYHKCLYDEVKADAAVLENTAPDTTDALFAQALVALSEYQFDEANRLLTQAIEQDDARPELYTMRANSHIRTADEKKILADLEKALELYPDYAKAIGGKALWLFHHYEKVDLAAEAQRVLDISPNSHLGHTMLAEKYIRERAWEKALAEAELSIASASHPSIGYLIRGLVYQEQHELEKALKDYQKSAELDPRNAGAYHNIATVHLSENAHDKALEALEKALALDPDSSSLHALRAAVYKEQEKDDKAKKELEEAFKTDPNSASALYVRVIFSLYDQDPMKAMTDVGKLMEFFPNDPELMVLRAKVYLANLDIDLALDDLNKAALINKNIPDLYTVRAQAYLMKGDTSRAVDYGKKGMNLTPWDTNLQAILGEAYYQDGNSEKAVEVLTKAIESDPELTQAYYTLAMAQWDEGDVESALDSLLTMLEDKQDLNLEQIDVAEKAISFLKTVPKAEDGKRTQVNEEHKFSITYPVSWVPRPPVDANVFYRLHSKGIPVSVIEVIAGEFPSPVPPGYSSAALFLDIMKNTINSVGGEYTFISRESFKANGTTGCVDTYERTITNESGTNFPLKTRVYVFVSSRHYVVVQFETLLPLFDLTLEEVNEIIKTFTFTG